MEAVHSLEMFKNFYQTTASTFMKTANFSFWSLILQQKHNLLSSFLHNDLLKTTEYSLVELDIYSMFFVPCTVIQLCNV